MDKKLTTRQEYDETKAIVEALISRQISDLSKQMAQYEDEYMDILPLREKTPLIRYIEDYFYARNMKQKDGAKLLGINESVFSQILSGKRRITMPIAKRLHSKLELKVKGVIEVQGFQEFQKFQDVEPRQH